MQGLTRDSVISAYKRYAPVYDFVFGFSLEPGRKALSTVVAKQQPKSLLEVGVGTGLASTQTPASHFECGIDISHEMLLRAKQYAADNGAPISLARADAEQLPFPDNAFDCVTLPYVLSVTPNPERLLAEARRVCADAGFIYVLNHFNGAGKWRILEHIAAPLADKIGFTSELKLEVLDNQPWDIQHMQSVNAFGLSRLVTIRNRLAEQPASND